MRIALPCCASIWARQQGGRTNMLVELCVGQPGDVIAVGRVAFRRSFARE
jgi:hypothetical protein